MPTPQLTTHGTFVFRVTLTHEYDVLYVRTSYVEPHWYDGCKKHSNTQQQFFWIMRNKMTTAQNLNLNFTICEMNITLPRTQNHPA